MKIRIETSSLNSSNLSGIGYYTQRLCNALADKPGVSVSVSSFNFLRRHPLPRLDSRISQEVNRLFPLRVYAKLQSHRLAPAFDFYLHPVDLTIFTNYARWPSIKSRYTATVVHDLTFISHPELMEENNLPHLTRVVKRAIASSDLIITISDTIKQEIIKHFDIDNKKIIITPIPPNKEFFEPNTNEIHKKYHIPTKKYLFFISTIEPRKNLGLLVRTYSGLPKKILEEYSLVISGGLGWKSEDTMREVRDARASGLSVVYTGYIDENDKPALYQKASLFVMPSLYEGFGMPILEAAASGTPIVATDIPVFHEVGGKGIKYFTSDSVDSLKEAMLDVLEHESLRKSLTTEAKKQLSKFSWKHNTNTIVRAVEQLDNNR